ncbi:MAG: polysaccharide biosynthesis tyrosine autokinase [Kiritimatiellae bacterium]|nr:polysaccharide biosynthesis tyrosine autokinase [Kiritimatiellia bacterium]
MRDMFDPPASSAAAASPASAPAVPSGFPRKVFDIRRYLFLVVRRLWLVLLCFAVAVGFALVRMARQVPKYASEAHIHLVQPGGLPAALQNRENVLGSYLYTQRQLLLSRDVIEAAKAKLGLSPEQFSRKYDSLLVDVLWETAILFIRVTAYEPEFASDYANAIAEAFVEYKAVERSDSSRNTIVNLSQQAERLNGEIARLEDDMLAFVRENRVVGIDERGNVAAELLGDLSKQAAKFKTERMLLEAQQPLLNQASDDAILATLGYGAVLQPLPAQAAAPGGGADAAGAAPAGASDAESLIEHDVVSQPRWGDLKRENAMLEAQLANYRKKYKDAHPLIQETLRKLQENEDALKVEIQFALKQYYSQLEALTIRERAAKRVEQAWEDEALEIDRKQKAYDGLKRNIDRSQKLYDLIFNRLKEVDISAGIDQESVRIIESAQVPTAPVNAQNMQMLFLAALVGIGMGLALVFLLDLIDDSIRYPEEVSRALGVPFIGLIPAAARDRHGKNTSLLLDIDPTSGFAEAYRNVRSALLLDPDSAASKVVAVTSAVPQEGKTTTSINLAVCFAQAGSRVLLVDGDLHRGMLHHQLHVNAGWGLSDILSGRKTAEEVTQEIATVPGLSFIATGAFPDNPAELVMQNAFDAFLAAAKERYDLVIVDAPPTMVISEAAVIASKADATLFVVWAGRTSQKLLRTSVRQLLVRGANVLGVILNKLDLTRISSYGYSSYYHYYGYDYRYASTDEATAGAYGASGGQPAAGAAPEGVPPPSADGEA